jgi:hypothetical protein
MKPRSHDHGSAPKERGPDDCGGDAKGRCACEKCYGGAKRGERVQRSQRAQVTMRLGLDGRVLAVGGPPIGSALDHEYEPNIRSAQESPLAKGPIGSMPEAVADATPLGSALVRPFTPRDLGEEAPGLPPAGASISRRYAVEERPAIARAIEEAQADPASRPARFGTLPASFGNSETQLGFLPIEQQTLASLMDRLPMSGAVRDEIVRRVRALRPMWHPMLLEGLKAYAETDRPDFVRAFCDAAALIPLDWIGFVRGTLGRDAATTWIATLRTWVTYLVNLAPQWYAEAREALSAVAPADQLTTLQQFIVTHPRMVQAVSLPVTVAQFSTAVGQPTQQWVPPPPAPQTVCLVNGFDSTWGAPPDSYKGIALRFDPNYGAYVWDEPYTLARSQRDAFGQFAFNRMDFDLVQKFFSSNLYLLQPFRSAGSPAWLYRWISNTRDVQCSPP